MFAIAKQLREMLLYCWRGSVAALTGGGAPAYMPARVATAISLQQQEGEFLIAWVEAAVLVAWALLYALSRKTFPANAPLQPVPWTLAVYGVFIGARLLAARRKPLADWSVALSIVIDIAVLMLLIWSFHLQYRQPPAFYLKAPTLLYVFIFIALRALRFEARWVLLAGGAGAVGWLILLAYALAAKGGPGLVTHDYVRYMTSPAILLGAEFDKIASILTVTAILALALYRGRCLLARSVFEQVAARELSRFVARDVARKIVAADTAIEPGQAEFRAAAALFVDLRGFTALTRALPPDAVMELLASYQQTIVPLVQQHGGSVDKFLGDGMLASFGAVVRNETYAADALRASDGLVGALGAWRLARQSSGRVAPRIGIAVASGDLLFGAIGDETRLEYTVIGDAVNLAAKLEKHTKVEAVTALADAATYELALAQGYHAPAERDLRRQRRVDGIEDPVDLVVLAR